MTITLLEKRIFEDVMKDLWWDHPGFSCAVLSHSVMSLFATPWTAAREVPLSMGILQAKILAWVVMPSSRESSQLRQGSDPGLPHCRWILLPSEPPWSPWWPLNPMIRVLTRDTRERFDRQEKVRQRWRQRLEWGNHKPKNANGHKKLEEARNKIPAGASGGTRVLQTPWF